MSDEIEAEMEYQDREDAVYDCYLVKAEGVPIGYLYLAESTLLQPERLILKEGMRVVTIY